MIRFSLLIILIFSAIHSIADNGIKNKPAPLKSSMGNAFTIGVRFKEIGLAETFVLSLGPGKQITVKSDSLINFPGTYPKGYSYKIMQISGPRKCKFTPVTGIVGSANVEINCDGGVPEGYTLLNGKLVAPVGTRVVLENNGKDMLTIIASTPETYYTFPKPYLQGTTFNVLAKPGTPGFVYGYVITGGELNTIFPGSFITVYTARAFDLITRDKNNQVLATYYESWEPAICNAEGDDEGRYVAFISSVKGLDGSTGKHRQLFWRDRKNGITKLISKSVNGEEGNETSAAPVMDNSGTKLAFESYADNLVAGDGNKVRDIFLWAGDTLGVGSIQRVSTGKRGAEANAESFDATISGDGDAIAFSSASSNLTDAVEGTYTVNVYLRTLSAGTTKIISLDPKTKKGVGGAKPSISEDGGRIAFYSVSDKLVANDKNALWDIFLFDKYTPTLKRITMAYDGGERDQGTESSSRVVTPTISGNGKCITFASTSPNLVKDDHNGVQDVFIYSDEFKQIWRMSINNADEEGNGDSPIGQGEKIPISWDGSLVIFSSNAANLGSLAGNVFMRNWLNKETRPLTYTKNISVAPISISRRGKYAVFGCGTELDPRFRSTGIFAGFTGNSSCWLCK